MGGRFTEAIEFAHQQYFADHERPWDRPLPEIEDEDANGRAAFAPGQLEAVPLEELQGRILGPVPAPAK